MENNKYEKHKCPECGSANTCFDSREWKDVTGSQKLLCMADIAVCYDCLCEWNVKTGKIV